jgi:hypothetical protein
VIELCVVGEERSELDGIAGHEGCFEEFLVHASKFVEERSRSDSVLP